MALYNGQSRLRDVIFSHPAVIPVINRLGVRLGVGDGTIADSCRRLGIDSSFFLAVVNTYINDDYFPEDGSSFGFRETVDYLMKTDNDYLRLQIPNIERHLDMLMTRSRGENNLYLLRGFFHELKRELESCIAADIENLFPVLLGEDRGEVSYSGLLEGARHESVEEKIDDLLSFFVMHLKGEYEPNLCVAVVTAIFALRKDIRQNNRIRSRILLPQAERLFGNLSSNENSIRK